MAALKGCFKGTFEVNNYRHTVTLLKMEGDGGVSMSWIHDEMGYIRNGIYLILDLLVI